MVERAPRVVRRRGEFEAHKRATGFQHAPHLCQRAGTVGHVADAVSHGDDIVRRIGVGDVLRVHHFKVHRHLARRAVGVVGARHVEHLGHKVGALNVAGPFRTRCGEGHIAGSPCDVEHVRVLTDGRLAHHARKPCPVRAEARYGVEALVLLRDGREYSLHALGREVRGRFLAGGGVDAHRALHQVKMIGRLSSFQYSATFWGVGCDPIGSPQSVGCGMRRGEVLLRLAGFGVGVSGALLDGCDGRARCAARDRPAPGKRALVAVFDGKPRSLRGSS